jgi:hypothetical protein
MAQFKFNVADAPAGGGFDPIPAGRYNVVITDSDLCDTKAGDGQYIKLTFKVLEGDFSGRLIWSNLNINNPNEKAVEIAQRELAAICAAVGLPAIEEDTAELHGIPLSGMVKIKPEQGGYPASNTISGFKAAVEASGEEAPWS